MEVWTRWKNKRDGGGDGGNNIIVALLIIALIAHNGREVHGVLQGVPTWM